MRGRNWGLVGLVSLALIAPAGPQAGAEPPVTLPAEAAGAVASSNVSFVANFPDISAIGAKLLGDKLYVTGVDGLTIYDVGLTGLPVPIGALPLPHWENEDVDTNGEILLVAADHFVGNSAYGWLDVPRSSAAPLNVLYVIDVSVPSAPVLRARTAVPSSHTVTCVNDCRYAWLAGDGGIAVMDLRNPSNPRFLGRIYVEAGTTHDVQVDAKGIAWTAGTGGLSAYIPRSNEPLKPTRVIASDYFDNQFIIHNSLRPGAKTWKKASSWSAPIKENELVYVTEEDWLPASNQNCARDGSFQTGLYRQVGTKKKLLPLDHWNLGRGTSGELTGSKKGDVAAFCSSHYFDVRSKVASVAWYEQGVRFLSVKDPYKIRQVGFWRPLNSAAWSAMYIGEYVYVFDLVRGLDVLHFSGSASDPTVKTWIDPVPRTRPSDRWRYACRLPV